MAEPISRSVRDSESADRPSIRKRPEFREDIKRVFEAIVYVIEDLWSYPSDKHHPLRKVIGNRKSPQKMRVRKDGLGQQWHEGAARVEVLAGAKCLHLHYWQCYDGSYEFSNVTDDHDDATIYP